MFVIWVDIVDPGRLAPNGQSMTILNVFRTMLVGSALVLSLTLGPRGSDGQTKVVSPRQMTVGALNDVCTATDDASKSACKFYILGVFEGAVLGSKLDKPKGQFCQSEDVSSVKMEASVKKALSADLTMFHQDRDMPAVSFIIAVMVREYPCVNPK